MSGDLGTTNLWLAALTVTVILQAIGLAILAVSVMRLMRRAQDVLDRADATIGPLAIKAGAALDEIHELTSAARRAEQTIRSTTETVGAGVQVARAFVNRRFWPILGVARGVRAVAGVIASRRAARRSATAGRDELAEADFTYEGGANASSRT
jgi:uncharacterized protein YoxC